MNLFRREFTDPEKVLKHAAGPAPWYIRAFPPRLNGVIWKDSAEIYPDTGATLLTKQNGDVVAIVGMYCYVLAINENRLVVWYQRYDTVSIRHVKTINFCFLDVADLKPIRNVQKILEKLPNKPNDLEVHYESENRFEVPTDLEPGTHSVVYPEEFSFTDELLIWGYNTSELFRPSFGKNNDLCLFILRPLSGTVEIIPQDWFNNSEDLDFGYQWVTRVARDVTTGRIFGDGIRISQFALDKSLRNVEKWFNDEPYFKTSG
ncbi:MAG: hypothetical protein ACRD6X_08135 [Pyrinomonadaceae bacterium]